MNFRPDSSKVTTAALSLLIACGGMGGTALAASSTPGMTGAQRAVSAATTQAQSSSAGFQLDYFHVDKASKTYAIQLKNGVSASFDFESGIATLTDITGKQTTFPLEQVLLEEADGDSQVAAELYTQMYQSITAPKSDAIIVYAGTGGTASNFRAGPGSVSPKFWNPPPRDTGGFGQDEGSLWARPSHGDCFPIPGSCNEWGGGLTSWGDYNNWGQRSFGDPPPTPKPPSPDNCNPGDVNCVLWEHDRQISCDNATSDNLSQVGTDVLAGVACGTSELGVPALVCGGMLIKMATGLHRLHKDQTKCRSPFPGR